VQGKPVWIDKFEALVVYAFPLRLANLLSILMFTLIFSYLISIERGVGAIGLPSAIMLAYVSLIMFFGSLFVIADYSTLGYQEIPNVSPNLLKSERGRIFKVVIIVSAILSIFPIIENSFWQLVYLLLCLVIVPLALSVLILESKLFSALNPLKWAAVLISVEYDKRIIQYFVLQMSSLLMGYIALFVNYGFLNLLTMALFLAVLMAQFRSLGVVIHSNANALGLKVQYSTDVEERQTLAASNQALSAFCDSIHMQWSSGQHELVWERLQSKRQEDNFESEADLFDRLRGWEKPSMAVRFGQEYIHRLVKKDAIETAWEVLEFCFENNDNEYKILSALTLMELTNRADTFKRKHISVSILKFFETDFPNYPETAQILLRAAKMAADDLGDYKTAKTLMRQLRRKHSSIYQDKTYLGLRKILNT